MAQPDMSLFERAKQAASFLKGRLPEDLRTPKVAIVCGSGLGGLADTVHAELRAEYDYSSIPYFPRPTGKVLPLRTQDHGQANVHSRGTRWETGIRASWPANSCRADGWPCPVRARQSSGGDQQLIFDARCSYYEGHSMDQVTFPVRVFKLLGVDTVVCEWDTTISTEGRANLNT